MVAELICIPANGAGGFPFLHILTNACHLWIYGSQSDSCETINVLEENIGSKIWNFYHRSYIFFWSI